MASKFKKNEIVILNYINAPADVVKIEKLMTYGEAKDAGIEDKLQAFSKTDRDTWWYLVRIPGRATSYWFPEERLLKYNLFNRVISGINNTKINSAEDLGKIFHMPTYKSMTDFN